MSIVIYIVKDNNPRLIDDLPSLDACYEAYECLVDSIR